MVTVSVVAVAIMMVMVVVVLVVGVASGGGDGATAQRTRQNRQQSHTTSLGSFEQSSELPVLWQNNCSDVVPEGSCGSFTVTGGGNKLE